jgi:ABC-type oligopeptide transport system substrate-binding subunit
VQEFLDGTAAEVTGLEVRSERDLQIHLAEPLPIYPALLCHQRTAVVRLAPARDGVPATPVGTGPFRIASWEPQRVVLERHAGYWKG